MSDFGLRRAARRQDRVKRRRKRSACGCGLEMDVHHRLQTAAHAVALTIGIHTSAHTTCLLLSWHLICTAAKHSARNLGNLSRTQPQSSVSPSSKSRTPTVLHEQWRRTTRNLHCESWRPSLGSTESVSFEFRDTLQSVRTQLTAPTCDTQVTQPGRLLCNRKWFWVLICIRDSVVGTVTRYALDGSGFEPHRRLKFLIITPVQACPGDHRASWSMSIRSKAPEAWR